VFLSTADYLLHLRLLEPRWIDQKSLRSRLQVRLYRYHHLLMPPLRYPRRTWDSCMRLHGLTSYPFAMEVVFALETIPGKRHLNLSQTSGKAGTSVYCERSCFPRKFWPSKNLMLSTRLKLNIPMQSPLSVFSY
jgi:hypothetical protein